MSTDTLPSELKDESPATRHVFHVLSDEWTSDGRLRELTGYSQPTVSRACRMIQGHGLADRRRNEADPRIIETRLR
jgi:hypothetical protein